MSPVEIAFGSDVGEQRGEVFNAAIGEKRDERSVGHGTADRGRGGGYDTCSRRLAMPPQGRTMPPGMPLYAGWIDDVLPENKAKAS